MNELIGKQLGPYQITEKLGEGGMACVFKALQPSMNRSVALKVLPQRYADAPEFAERFEQEARVLATLQHPHILPVFDYGRENGYAYIAMPWIVGGELTSEMTGAPLALKRLVQIISEVGDALDYAHERGVIHRDVKPSNILLDARGHCLLTDFGIAKLIANGQSASPNGSLIGTPAYMAPEQSMGDNVDARSDIYSLGVVLYELATGRPPYRAETPLAVVMKHLHDPLPSPRQINPTLAPEVEAVILKSLAKGPADRYQRAGQLVDALSRAYALLDRHAHADTRLVDAVAPPILGFAAIDRPDQPTIDFASLEQPDAPVVADFRLVPSSTAPARRLLPLLLLGLLALAVGLGAWWFSLPSSSQPFDPFSARAPSTTLEPSAAPAEAQSQDSARFGAEPPPPAAPINPVDSSLPTPAELFEAEANAQAESLAPSLEAAAIPEASVGTELAPPSKPLLAEPPQPQETASYDTFDDAQFTGDYDRARWDADPEQSALIEQRGGMLSMAGLPDEGSALLAVDATQIEPSKVASFTVHTRLNRADSARSGSAGFTIGRTDDPEWWLSCTVDGVRNSANARVQCDSSDGLNVSGQTAGESDWRELKAEFDFKRAQVRLLTDRELLSRVPLKNIESLRRSKLHLQLAAWAEEEGDVNGEFDRVELITRD